MNETGEYLGLFARFPFTLRKFPRGRMTLEQAGRIVAERIERREEQFLEIAAINGEVANLTAADRAPEHVGRGFDQRLLGRHVDSLARGACLQVHVDASLGRHVHFDL